MKIVKTQTPPPTVTIELNKNEAEYLLKHIGDNNASGATFARLAELLRQEGYSAY